VVELLGRLEEIDAAALEPVLCRALGSETARIEEWRSEPLGGGTGAALGGGAPHRVTGSARVDGAIRHWSIVVKVLRAPEGAANQFNQPDIGGMFYWKRDALAYSSGLLNALPAGFAAPRCYGIDEWDDGIRLWLEDVAEPAGKPWSLARYGEAARHLGRFNGAYLAGQPTPDQPWLCRDVLRWREPVVAPIWGRIASLDDARVRRAWPGSLAQRALRVWNEREFFLDALERVPRVFCHGDADRRNLFARNVANGETETVAVDWECTGPRAVGTDVANLVFASVLWAHDPDPADVATLDRLGFEGYLAGLREAGWTGPDDPVRLGYALTVALQFGAFAGSVVVGFVDEAERPRIEAAFAGSLEDILDRHAAIQPLVLDLADEARALLAFS
jgi:hypothetical protein